jgi:hypothetical protein
MDFSTVTLKINIMSETASTIPPKGLGKIQLSDFLKSVGLAVFTNALMSLYSLLNSGAWPTKEDWMDILQTSVAFMISYMLKNLLTNNTGQLLKKDQPTVTVSAPELDKVIDIAQEKTK